LVDIGGIGVGGSTLPLTSASLAVSPTVSSPSVSSSALKRDIGSAGPPSLNAPEPYATTQRPSIRT
jgi:hypothetical protein